MALHECHLRVIQQLSENILFLFSVGAADMWGGPTICWKWALCEGGGGIQQASSPPTYLSPYLGFISTAVVKFPDSGNSGEKGSTSAHSPSKQGVQGRSVKQPVVSPRGKSRERMKHARAQVASFIRFRTPKSGNGPL